MLTKLKRIVKEVNQTPILDDALSGVAKSLKEALNNILPCAQRTA